ncbi:hypothetical protein PpBr36_02965 [Pyricularia pennisetigena]|uniref:hypothetical protein n=1 Tax=Pyricularia pennisetigena TaxID=1578925 RepID=UPI00115214E8|nr:hypothetical protein PpBr36_02965 [Pyricularia pennisetigena]TLS30297.1 hypothetical protein PpBr36_02965 [Pyricularia pennisetigena]
MVLGRLKLPPTIARRLFSVRPYSTSTDSTPAAASNLSRHYLGPKPPLAEAIDAEWRQLLKDLRENHALTQGDELEPLQSEPQAPWLLQLTGTSANLQPSDFYRLAPQSNHVHYWTTQGSLAVVTQARHYTTQEGVDHYRLYFESEAGALRYRDEALRLHQLSKDLKHAIAHPPLPRKEKRKKAKAKTKKAKKFAESVLESLESMDEQDKGGPEAEVEPQVSNEQQSVPSMPWGALNQRKESPKPKPKPKPTPRPEDLAAEARTFTLAPPDTELDLQGPFEPDPADKPPCVARVTQVLFVISGGSGNGFSRSALGRLIAADGERRNLRWRLRGGASVLPLRVDMSTAARTARKEAGVDNSGDMLRQAIELAQAVETSNETDNDTPYMRYVLSFEDGPEAKRFARDWHMRKLVFNNGDLVFFVKATALW